MLLLTGFVVHLRRETRAQAALDRRRRAQQTAAEGRRRRTAAAPARYPVEVEHVLPAEHDQPLRVDAEADLVAVQHAAAVAQAVSDVDLPYDAEVDRAWEPVPVPLPTYVTAPKAPRSVRVIDLTKPGLWTSGHLDPEEAERLVAEALARGDEVAEPHRAVSHRRPARAGRRRRHRRLGELVIERRRAANG